MAATRPTARRGLRLAQPTAVDSAELAATLDDIVAPPRQPTYRLWLQLRLRGEAAAKDVAFEHDIQTSALSPPELTLGDNHASYTDATNGPR